jgi:hypothetical protein
MTTMSLPNWRGWSVLAGIALLAGWLLAPLPEAPDSLVRARRDDWSLAALPRRFDQTSLAGAVMAASYWGAVPAAGGAGAEAPLPDPRWRVAAVFGGVGEAGALIVFEAPDKEPRRVRVGDVLPSGHKIVSIGERDVCVRIGKKVYSLGVERRVQ